MLPTPLFFAGLPSLSGFKCSAQFKVLLRTREQGAHFAHLGSRRVGLAIMENSANQWLHRDRLIGFVSLQNGVESFI